MSDGVPFELANATLTAITGAGFTADGDEAATAGDAKWTGYADAIVEERVRVAITASGVGTQRVDKLTVPGDLIATDGADVTITTGDTVTFLYAGGEQTRGIREIAPQIDPDGIDSLVVIYLLDA